MSQIYNGSARDISQQYMARTPEPTDAETPLVPFGAQPGVGGVPVMHDSTSNDAGHHDTAPSQDSHSQFDAPIDPNLVNAFDMVHGTSKGHIVQHGQQIPLLLGHLFKRPLIRQWVLQDKVYREVDDREPSQFELFFDLVMVGVIHQVAEGAAEMASGLNVAKFVLCFYPAWSVWSDVRSFINVSGTDDVWQRIYTLLIMITLVGYVANVTGIVIRKEEEEPGLADGGTTGSAEANHKRALMGVLGSAGAALVKRASESSSGTAHNLVTRIGNTKFWFAEGWHAAIASAFGFYLVAKGCRLLLYIVYGIWLPKFRKALFLQALALIVISMVYLPIIFISSPEVIVILICVGVIAELAIRYIVAAVLQYMHGRAKHKGHKTYWPAHSLPHMMERTTLFIIVVYGEILVQTTYVASLGDFGVHSQFGRSALAIVIAFMLMWIYFDVDSSRTYVHGLKRHWFTSITYNHLHFPLSASLILMSSTLPILIEQETVEQDCLWVFAGSIACAMFCMGLIGLLHKSLDRWGSSLIPKSARIASRFVLAGLFAVMPKLHIWTSSEFLGAHAAILAAAVAFETFGKLGAVGRIYDPVRAGELKRQRLGLAASHATMHTSGDIPMAEMTHGANATTAMQPHHTEKAGMAGSANGSSVLLGSTRSGRPLSTMLDQGLRRLHKDGRIKGPDRRASWHEYDDLTGEEMGENDVGIESELGRIEAKEMASGERWAHVAI